MKKIIFLLVLLYIMFHSIAAHTEISNEDLLSDYDDALRYLEEYNPCQPIIRQQYPNFDVLCEEYRKKVQLNGKTPEDLYVILADLFLRIGNPGHLSVLSPEDIDSYIFIAKQRLILGISSFLMFFTILKETFCCFVLPPSNPS